MAGTTTVPAMGVLGEAADGELGKRWGLVGGEESRVPIGPTPLPPVLSSDDLQRAARALYDSRTDGAMARYQCAPRALWDDLGRALRSE